MHLILEPGIESEDAMVTGVVATPRDFLIWHGPTEISIAKRGPASGGKLLRAV